MKKGLWIVITGLDGSGKTTLKSRLVGYLKEQGKLVKDFKSPYDKYLLGLLDVIGGGLPWQDNYTDQLLFTLDNRILSQRVKEWRSQFDVLVSQRGFLDSFVHGEVRGYNYQQVDDLQKTSEMEKCDVMIHLNASPEVAFSRISDDPDADKFETIEYITQQAVATKKAFDELQSGNPSLKAFEGTKNIYVDTTNLSLDETFDVVLEQLKKMFVIK